MPFQERHKVLRARFPRAEQFTELVKRTRIEWCPHLFIDLAHSDHCRIICAGASSLSLCVKSPTALLAGPVVELARSVSDLFVLQEGTDTPVDQRYVAPALQDVFHLGSLE